ncbi:MAG: adenylate kinase [Nitrospiria bacterium]
MRLVFLGPPGVGKGTQAGKLSKKYDIPHIATGDILRKSMSDRTTLGLQAKSYIDSGKLVPDALVIELVHDRLNKEDAKSGFILDGFPRTLGQGDALQGVLDREGSHIDRVIYFSLDESDLVRRISGRRSCPACQSVYHVIFNRPQNDDVCDCGTKLIQRKDDVPHTVKERLLVYRNETSPLIAYYKEKDLLAEVDASGSLEEVRGKVEALIGASIS